KTDRRWSSQSAVTPIVGRDLPVAPSPLVDFRSSDPHATTEPATASADNQPRAGRNENDQGFTIRWSTPPPIFRSTPPFAFRRGRAGLPSRRRSEGPDRRSGAAHATPLRRSRHETRG